MRNHTVHNNTNLVREAASLVCYDRMSEQDLPQVGTEEDFIIDLMQDTTGKPHDYLEAFVHHQIEDDEWSVQ